MIEPPRTAMMLKSARGLKPTPHNICGVSFTIDCSSVVHHSFADLKALSFAFEGASCTAFGGGSTDVINGSGVEFEIADGQPKKR